MTGAMTSDLPPGGVPPARAPASSPVSDALLEQAARFHARLADAPHDPDLLLNIERWKALSPSHVQALHEAERLWALMGPPARVERPSRSPRRASVGIGAGIAAALAALILSPMLGRSWQDLRSDAVSAVGERRELALADGTRVTLGSDTALALDVDADSRNVRMFRGEAFFAVKHDPAHPFRVRSGDATVTVLGTRFDVRMAGGDTQVTVEEGRVRLSGPGGSRILGAETQGLAGPRSTLARAAYSADATAWRRGRAVFYDAPLPQVVDELSRYRSGAIYLATPALRARRITGSFSTARPDKTLAALRASLGAQSLSLPGGVVVLY
ncbi:MAG: FecR family protein [Candidatus Andeanibacterium colombiense]|uniref:FecR family protein n=1 Tax=Candidatus Andeanibacterium colombiense TaxID=3121345 RepID=A0AAJ5X222_9SPHN|nr:MAG: FecR family protein [Sphingomonadaceae bacterium]